MWGWSREAGRRVSEVCVVCDSRGKLFSSCLLLAQWSLVSVYFGDHFDSPLPSPREAEEVFDAAGLIFSPTVVPEQCKGWSVWGASQALEKEQVLEGNSWGWEHIFLGACAEVRVRPALIGRDFEFTLLQGLPWVSGTAVLLSAVNRRPCTGIGWTFSLGRKARPVWNHTCLKPHICTRCECFCTFTCYSSCLLGSTEVPRECMSLLITCMLMF